METASEETKKEEKPQGPKKFVIGIQYRQAGKIYTYLTDDATLTHCDWVVVENEQGTSVGTVALPPAEVLERDLPADIKKVLRRATPEDIEQANTQREREFEIFDFFSQKVAERQLPMKPLTAELRDGEKKVILTFFAEDRVDFRSLVKDLASALHMRIEMRQIGARDEVKYKGGIGPCGLVTCCFQHLRQFQSISIQMAKNQGLTPNPAKLTGMCGKLKCCLAYENALYAELRQRMPRVGMLVKTPQGNGKITSLNVIREQCMVRLDDGGDVIVPLHDITPQTAKREENTEGKKEEQKIKGQETARSETKEERKNLSEQERRGKREKQRHN
jgi:cell fate regulator YaaT (PSP1 superfamily)